VIRSKVSVLWWRIPPLASRRAWRAPADEKPDCKRSGRRLFRSRPRRWRWLGFCAARADRVRQRHRVGDRRGVRVSEVKPFSLDAHAAAPCTNGDEVTSLVGLPDLGEDLVSVHDIASHDPKLSRCNRPTSLSRLLLAGEDWQNVSPVGRVVFQPRGAASLVAAEIDDVVVIWPRTCIELLRPSKRCSAKVTVDLDHLRRCNGTIDTAGATTASTFSGEGCLRYSLAFGG
jgi:hypothetical protein